MKQSYSSSWTLPVFCGTIFLLTLWGLLALYACREAFGESDFLWRKQLLSTLAGAGLFLAAAFCKGLRNRKFLLLGSAVTIGMLLLVPFCGVRVRGMSGWFEFFGVSIQPSELGRIFFLLGLLEIQKNMKAERRFVVMACWTLLWTTPLLLQPDFGTASVYTAVFAAVFFIGGGRKRDLLILGTAALAATGYFLATHSYALGRLSGFFAPEENLAGSGWHTIQFRLALANGGWAGTKLGHAFWSRHYLPFPQNDSIFAAMGETLGFGGIMPALLLYGLCFYALKRMAEQGGEKGFFTTGVLAFLGFQTLLHLLVNTALVPATGVPLPFISAGGSALAGTMLLCGGVLNFQKRP